MYITRPLVREYSKITPFVPTNIINASIGKGALNSFINHLNTDSSKTF